MASLNDNDRTAEGGGALAGEVPGPGLAMLGRLIERLGWRRTAALAAAGLTLAALAVTLLLDTILAPIVDMRLAHIVGASAVTLLLVIPCLAVSLRLIEHLSRTSQRLLVEIDRRLVAEQQLRRLATTDELTGLHNRRHFVERMRLALAVARRYDQWCALAIVDIDQFKQLNDRLGHQAGDQALRALAAVLLGNLRASDLAARFGGDEFVVLMPLTEPHAAQLAAERLQGAIRADGGAFGLTVSIGVTALFGAAAAFEDLMAHADLALYEAKRGGRDQVRTHFTKLPPSSRLLAAG